MLTKIIRVPTRFLGVLILIFAFVGDYSLRELLADCMISAAFGVLVVILKLLYLPIGLIKIGMVLVGIMEVKLRVAMPRLKTPFDMIDHYFRSDFTCFGNSSAYADKGNSRASARRGSRHS